MIINKFILEEYIMVCGWCILGKKNLMCWNEMVKKKIEKWKQENKWNWVKDWNLREKNIYLYISLLLWKKKKWKKNEKRKIYFFGSGWEKKNEKQLFELMDDMNLFISCLEEFLY